MTNKRKLIDYYEELIHRVSGEDKKYIEEQIKKIKGELGE